MNQIWILTFQRSITGYVLVAARRSGRKALTGEDIPRHVLDYCLIPEGTLCPPPEVQKHLEETYGRVFRLRHRAEIVFPVVRRPRKLPTIRDFIEAVGVASTLRETLVAIDKYNWEHVWIRTDAGKSYHYHTPDLNSLPEDTPIRAVGAGGIAWDGSDWETSHEEETSVRTLKRDLLSVRRAAQDAYEEYLTQREDGEGAEA